MDAESHQQQRRGGQGEPGPVGQAGLAGIVVVDDEGD
jgi:hypothetical protein